MRAKRRHGAVGTLCLALVNGMAVGTLAEAAPAAATTAPPYTSSGTGYYCDPNTSCVAVVSADHNTGRLSIDLSATGSVYYEPGACVRPPYDPRPCPASVEESGAYGRAWVLQKIAVPTGVSAVSFTITVQTDEATASGASASALLSAWAGQSDCRTCSGQTEQTIVSSPLSSSAPAATRTLQFTYRSTSGPIPAGPLTVVVDLSGDARGVGPNEVRASGRVERISWTFPPA